MHASFAIFAALPPARGEMERLAISELEEIGDYPRRSAIYAVVKQFITLFIPIHLAICSTLVVCFEVMEWLNKSFTRP